MKVLMLGRTDLRKMPGGDLVQIEQTAAALKALGVEVEVSTNWEVEMEDFDVIHVFQLDWNSECFLYARNAKLVGKPVVLSPIHHNIHEVDLWENNFAFGLRKVSNFFFHNQFTRDTIKILYRAMFSDKNKRLPAIYALSMGLKNLHAQTLGLADIVLVQTLKEAQDLKETYKTDFKWEKVSNGVGDVFLSDKVHDENYFPFKDYIVCVGRIESRKNQLSVITAVENLRAATGDNLQLVFVGKASQTNASYVSKFLKEVKQRDWITHIDWIDYNRMPVVYSNAKVAVSASFFETTGLTLLEALYSKCNAVATGPRAQEVLGEYASYCNPVDISSIEQAISAELAKPRPLLPKNYAEEYTWKKVALKTLDVYGRVLLK